jgi:lipid II:glycine glycyltransferase (peptidoglycan interpeptide bridge formation enzyme)
MTLTVRNVTARTEWDDALRKLPYAHILQSWEWGEFKRVTGWMPVRLAFHRGGGGGEPVALASVGARRVGPLTVMYAPKGPALDYADTALVGEVLGYLEDMARRRGAVWLKIDPDVIAATGVPDEPDDAPDPVGARVTALLMARGWRFSDDQVQFRNTIALDLTRAEDDLLAAMSQNTRRKVRTAEKKGITVREATLDDLSTLYDLYAVTGARDGFLIRPAAYYLHEWRYLMEAGLASALIAEDAGVPVAHVVLFHFGRTCWYFYGASDNASREKMPNYALQWAAMRWAKAHGYALYDLWGAPDTFDENDSMWGVYEFKRGFRGTVRRYIGAWDYAPYPPLYFAYTRLWPRVLNWLRARRG